MKDAYKAPRGGAGDTERAAVMMAACYLWTRVSDQEGETAREGLRRWLSGKETDLMQVEWFWDQEPDPATSRPEFDRLQRGVKDGEINAVVLWSLDQLPERFQDKVTTLASWCERGVKIVVVSQEIELSPAVGQDVSALLRGLAKAELEVRRKRQKAGVASAKKRGVYLGRKPGTTKEKPHRALELRGKGLTAREIAETLGVSERTVFRYLGTKEEKKRPVSRKGAKP
jgi:DNA invertase Pin-like site-specific DNA recombinase